MAYTYDKYLGQQASGKGGKIWESEKGPISAVLYADAGASAILAEQGIGRRQRNLFIKTALVFAGEFWVRAFLPMRFTDYARKLGYMASSVWESLKKKLTGQVIPLVGIGDYRKSRSYPPGTMRASVLNNVSVDAVGIEGKAKVTIRMPLGHPVQVKTTAVLHRIPPWEMKRIAEELEKYLAKMLKTLPAEGGTLTGSSSEWRPPALQLGRPAASTINRPAAGGIGRAA